MPGSLYLVATPIGNLEDITLRALAVLRSVELIAAEDTRHTRRLLQRHGIDRPLISYHEHNERGRAAELAGRLQSGADIALVTDAGTPTISDPGYHLVQQALAGGSPVIAIPGPAAFLAALSVSGLSLARGFTFAGYLPPKSGARRRRLEALKDRTEPLCFYEAPHRILAALEDALEILGDRPACLARELTKVHEELVRGRLSDLLESARSRNPRGEYTLVIEGLRS
ncbi:MAG TPA: 16S rRNA (cytidine(1402)-2'-O)-methyltransferase [Acidobacteriota bacterium]